jgi:membrane-associated protein
MSEATIEAVLASPWLLGVLLVAVVVDGPFPFLPSEPLLFAAVARAVGVGDLPMFLGLVVATIAGSLLGDLLIYGVARSSRRLLPEGQNRVSRWVHRHMHRRPIVALAAVRVIPGGRLASVAAAGRTDLPFRRFMPATLTSSLLWTTWMIGFGVALGGVTGGDPLISVGASLLLGLLVTVVGSVAERLHRRLRRPATASTT